jgi:hypothetical protein
MRVVLIGIWAFILGFSGWSSTADSIESCRVTPARNNDVNMRGGPGINYPQADTLEPNEEVIVTGQRVGDDGRVWYRTFDGGWVRSDAINELGDCSDIAEVNAPPDYCLGREQLSKRPGLSGKPSLITTEHFVIHYTLTGEDATTSEFVLEVADTVDQAFLIQIDEMGWTLPPPDCGEGGDERFDLYILELTDEGILGYASPEQTIGDNPFSELEETYAAYSYLAIDNDFGSVDTSLDVMRATVAHEIHHNLQFTFDFGDAYGYFDESDAVYTEVYVYPEYEDAANYLLSYLNTPDLCFGYEGNLDEGTRGYGEWIIIDSFVQDYGVRVMPDVFYKNRAIYEGYESFERAAEELNTTPQNLLLRAQIRNLLIDHSLPLRHMRPVDVEVIVDDTGRFDPVDGVQELGADFVRLLVDGTYEVEIDSDYTDMYFVGINTTAKVAQVAELGRNGIIDTRDYDQSYLIMFNTNDLVDQFSCEFDDWSLRVRESSDAPTPLMEEVWDASNFYAPMYVAGDENTTLHIARTYNDIFVFPTYLRENEELRLGAYADDLDLLILVNTEVSLDDELEREEDINPELRFTADEDGVYYVIVTPNDESASEGNFEFDIRVR